MCSKDGEAIVLLMEVVPDTAGDIRITGIMLYPAGAPARGSNLATLNGGLTQRSRSFIARVSSIADGSKTVLWRIYDSG
jgi:hypothetical protein